MLNNPNHFRGIVIALVAGAGFVVLAVVYLDTESSALMSQMIGVFILIFGLIGFAALAAWLVRLIIHKVSKHKK